MVYPIANSKTKVLAQEYHDVRKWKWVARKPRPSVSSSFQTLKTYCLALSLYLCQPEGKRESRSFQPSLPFPLSIVLENGHSGFLNHKIW